MWISFLFDENKSLTLKISIDRSIVAPVHWGNVLDGISARYKRYLRGEINRLLIILTTPFKVIGMLHSDSNKSIVSFA